MPDINQQKEIAHLLALQDISVYHLLKLILFLLASLGISITGEIHQVPVAIDDKMIDERGLSWRG